MWSGSWKKVLVKAYLFGRLSTILSAWCEFDWSGCPLTHRSLKGYFIHLDKFRVSWKMKKQDMVSSSMAEAKYRAMQYTVCDVKWIKYILTEILVDHSSPIRL